MKQRALLRPRIDTPSAMPLVVEARALAEHLERVALRKSRVLWELDTTLSKRCGELAREAQRIAFRLEDVEEDAGAVAIRLNLTARFVTLRAEADRLAPRS